MSDRDSVMAQVPGLVEIKATQLSPPPPWALLERQLMELMEEAVQPVVDKYAEKGGAYYYADDVDDLYERAYNWGLFYAMGADRKVLDLGLQQWHATTRFFADDIVSRVHPRFQPQIHNEYYNLASPGANEWYHQGEGNMAFYHFGLADPTISENVRRARRFAAMFMDEDPEAPNYDPHYKVFRSPIQTSVGPMRHARGDNVRMWLQDYETDYESGHRPYKVRATLDPVVTNLESNWFEEPQRRDEILQLFDDIVLKGDVPHSLGSTALITNAYLYTGQDKYKRWVLDYTEGWMERIQRIVGQRQGLWWGGLYGWNTFVGHYIMFSALTIAAECALLLSGDFGYLELLRSQIKLFLDNAILRADGQLLLPARYGPAGWEYVSENYSYERGRFVPYRMQELAHLYHASMAAEDYDLIVRIRDTDKMCDWNHVPVLGKKSYADTEMARFQFYDGKNPDWPMKILQAEYQNALNDFLSIQDETRDDLILIAENAGTPDPVYTKGLTQVTMGAPQSVYTGGLLRATVRYFDSDRSRPGLPLDVAALVDSLGADSAGIQLVNVNAGETRNLIVQAGAFAEHAFLSVSHTDKTLPVNSKYFAVQLPPGTSIRLDVAMRRFAHRPTYAFPWHGEVIPVPYQ